LVRFLGLNRGLYIEGNDFVAQHRSREWLRLFKVSCDSNGIDNQVTRLNSPRDGRFGARTINYGQNAYYANVPDWLHVEEGGEAILTCNANKVRGVYYDGEGAYRTYAQSVSFIGMNNQGGSNRADFLRDVLNELAGYQGNLTGHVLNNINGEPIESARIEIVGLNIHAVTDGNGYFTINRFPVEQFRLAVQADGYTNLEAADFTFAGEPDLDLELRMLHPEMMIDQNELSVELLAEQQRSIEIAISNPGDGPLEMAFRPRAVRSHAEPWGPLAQFEAGPVLNDTRLEGALFFRDHYWIAGGGSGGANPNYLYKLDRDWQLVETYDQGSFSLYGWRDLTTDGSYIYGVDSAYIAQFDPETGARTGVNIPTPVNPAWGVAYDESNGLFWVACTGTNIFGIDSEGNVVQSVRNNGRFRISGLAYWAGDPDGKPLYILGEYEDVDGRIVKMDPADGEPVVVMDIPLGTDERMGGGDFSNEVFPFTTSLVLQMQRGVESVRNLEAGTNFNWLTIEPTSLLIEAGSTNAINLRFNSAGFNVGDVAVAYIQLDHNTLAEEPFIDVQMEVVEAPPNNTDDDSNVPFTFGIESVFPNPFNGRSTLGFSLNQPGIAILAVYDLAGREVALLVNSDLPAGRHSISLDATSWPTGIYLAKLERSGSVDQVKLTLIK